MKRRAIKLIIATVIALLLFAVFYLYAVMPSSNASTDKVRPVTLKLKTEIITSGLNHPWALAFLPDGRLLVTERPGTLRVISQNGTVSEPIENVPEVYEAGQGGLLDVMPDPGFDENQTLYLSYAEKEGDKAGTAVARAILNGNRLEKVEVIFRQQPKTGGVNHYGSRFAFSPEGMLFFTLGERFDEMKEAQKLDNHLGKVIRLQPDGSIPADNPFVNQSGALPAIWSYGHRNPQGAAIHPESGKLWIHEHGPKGGDELNIPLAGKNYGWPKASYGIHYWMVPIRDEHAGRGFTEPIYHWTPSIAPSGMAFITKSTYPDWENSLFIGALAGRKLVRLVVDGETVTAEEHYLTDKDWRIRDVAEGPDGALYLLTDSDEGKLVLVVPE